MVTISKARGVVSLMHLSTVAQNKISFTVLGADIMASMMHFLSTEPDVLALKFL